MHLQRVLKTAFRGCGLDLQEVRRSQPWQELCHHFALLRTKYPISTELGALLHAGIHRVGMLLSEGLTLEEVAAQASGTACFRKQDPALLADACCLGEALQERAWRRLPRTFKAIDGLLLDELRLPLTPDELAQQWQSGGRRKRIQIVMLLARSLVTKTRIYSTLAEERAHQPAGRVLPDHFELQDVGERHPNCLGKGSIIAAFFKRIGAEMLAVVPILMHNRHYNDKRAESAAICLDTFLDLQGSLPLKAERRDYLEQTIQCGRKQAEEQSWLHMTIAVAIGGGEWMLVDTNYNIHSIIPDRWQMNVVHAQLMRSQPVLPGLSILKEDQTVMAQFDGEIDLCRANCALLKPLAEACFGQSRTREELINELAHSAVLDKLLTWSDFSPHYLDHTASRTRKAICTLLWFYHNENLWSNNRDKTDQQLLNLLPTDTQIRTALATLFYRFGTQGMVLMEEKEKAIEAGNEELHPRCQFSAIGPGLAFPVLAHVALAEGHAASWKVESRINEYWFDLHRLLYSAGRLVTNPQIAEQDAWRSAAILSRLPFVLPSTRYVLEVLGQTNT